MNKKTLNYQKFFYNTIDYTRKFKVQIHCRLIVLKYPQIIISNLKDLPVSSSSNDICDKLVFISSSQGSEIFVCLSLWNCKNEIISNWTSFYRIHHNLNYQWYINPIYNQTIITSEFSFSASFSVGMVFSSIVCDSNFVVTYCNIALQWLLAFHQ